MIKYFFKIFIFQEGEYLRQCCARILSLEPDLLLVAGGVARLAQEQLVAAGVALALGVRAPVLQRIARACRADVLNSVDAHVVRTPPRLGTCKAFYLLNCECISLEFLKIERYLLNDDSQPVSTFDQIVTSCVKVMLWS